MAGLATLPTEIVLLILGKLDYASEVSAVAQTCHRLCDVANDHLYSNYAKTYTPQSLQKVIENGNIDAVNKLFLAGVEFDNSGLLEESPQKTLLRLAACKGHVHIINAFAKFFGDSTVTDQACELAKKAVENGYPAILDHLLWMGVYLDIPDESNLRTILSLAAGQGQLECIQLLVDADCNVNTCDVFGQTPLWWACKEGHLDVVKFLVEAGADPYFASTEAPFTAPIYRAALDGHRAVVKYLLEKGAHPDLSAIANIEALGTLVVKELRKKDMILPLLLDPVKVAAEIGWCDDTTRYRLLMCAIACGYRDLANRISEMPCKANWGPSYCSTIEIAATHGYAEILGDLLSNSGERGSPEANGSCELALIKGASAGHQNVVDCVLGWSCILFIKSLGDSAIWAAMENESLMDYLLDQKVLRNFNDDENGCRESIIHAAMWSGNLKAFGRILQWCRKKQWDNVGSLEHDCVERQEYRQFNLIETAAVFGRVEVFNFILDKPWKRPKPAEKRWRSVLYFAAKHKRLDIVRIFLNSGFNIDALYGENARDPGQPLLTSFVDRRGILRRVENTEECMKAGVRLLVNRGANVNTTDANGWTALTMATSNYDLDMIKELLRLGADPFAGDHFTTTAFYKALADNSSLVSLELVETFLKTGQKRGRYPEFEQLLKSESGDEPEEGDAEWDPQPGEIGLSEPDWLRFQKMKRVRTLYWRLQHPLPEFEFTSNW